MRSWIRRIVANESQRADVGGSATHRLLSRRACLVFPGLGGFDERFEIGGFEDDDLCRRLHHSELRLLIAHGSFVHHRGHASFEANDIDWRVTQGENRVRFEAKWGADALRQPILVTACLIVKNEEQMLGPAWNRSGTPSTRSWSTTPARATARCRSPVRRAPRSWRANGRTPSRWPGTPRCPTPPASGCSPSMPTSDCRPIPTFCGPSSPTRFGRRGVPRRDREPARTGQSALRPHRHPHVPAAFGDMAASAARAGRGRRRSRPVACGPPTCRARG